MYFFFLEYLELVFFIVVYIGFLFGFLLEDLGFRVDNVIRNKQFLLFWKLDLDQNLCIVFICGCLEDFSLSYVWFLIVRFGGVIFGRFGFGDMGWCVQCGDKLENRFFFFVSLSCDCDFFYFLYNFFSFLRLFVIWDRFFFIEFVIGIFYFSLQRNFVWIFVGGFRVQCR